MIKKLFSHLEISRKTGSIIAACLIVGVVGSIMLTSSKAATPTAAVEAENGSIANGATTLSDISASGGKYVQFGSGSSGFVHPGIFDSRAQLDFVKAKILANQSPWVTLYNKAKAESIVSANYNPTPVTVLDCADNASTDCVNVNVDGQAAYLDALLWYYSGDPRYAQQAIKILNAWSSTLTSYSSANGSYLNAAWQAEMYPRAAEIIRYTYSPAAGDSTLNVATISNMFISILLPKLAANTPAMQSSNGNWDLSMTDGMMNIAIFTNDRATFNTALARWRGRAPAYVYSSTDNGGNGLPIAPPGGLANTTLKVQCFWLNSGSASAGGCNATGFHLADGQIQETCREYNHVGLGIAGLFNAAETAHIQGIDLYGEQRARLSKALEYNGSIMNSGVYPSDICAGAVPAVKNSNIITKPTYVAGYNEYANRLGMSLPEAYSTVQRVEASNVFGGDMNTPMVYEALTHYLVP